MHSFEVECACSPPQPTKMCIYFTTLDLSSNCVVLEHRSHLQCAERLQRAGLRANPSKLLWQQIGRANMLRLAGARETEFAAAVSVLPATCQPAVHPA